MFVAPTYFNYLNMTAPIFLRSCSILLGPTYIIEHVSWIFLLMLLCCRFWLVLWALCVVNHHWKQTIGFDCYGLGSNDILRFSRWQVLLKLLSWIQCTKWYLMQDICLPWFLTSIFCQVFLSWLIFCHLPFYKLLGKYKREHGSVKENK